MTTIFTHQTEPALNFESPGRAVLAGSVADMSPEAVGVLLMQVIRSHAAEMTGRASLDLVSVTLDVTGAMPETGLIAFTAESDRKTRTILFTGGRAEADGATILTATAVFQIS